MASVSNCLTLSQITLAENELKVVFSTNEKEIVLNRPLEQHEIQRHLQNPILSWYYLMQSVLIQFEANHFLIEHMLVTAQMTEGYPLEFVLFVKDWTAGISLFNTPLTRIKIVRPHNLPRRGGVHRA